MIAVNKADGDNRRRAEQAAAHYRAALRIIEPASRSWSPPVCTVSALEGTGLDGLWAEIERHARILGANGELATKRRGQRRRWFRSMLHDRLLDRLRDDGLIARLLPELERAVAEGEVAVPAAVERVLALVPLAGPGPA
jgi:LAO/AO transport system kinase